MVSCGCYIVDHLKEVEEEEVYELEVDRYVAICLMLAVLRYHETFTLFFKCK